MKSMFAALTLLSASLFVSRVLATPGRNPTPSPLALEMCAGSRIQSDAVTITRWSEWLGDGNTRWQLQLLRRHTGLHSTSQIRARLVHGTCAEAPYQLAPISSELWYPQADGQLSRSPRPMLGTTDIGDVFGYGGLGNAGTGWGGGGTGESVLNFGGLTSSGFEPPPPPPPSCNTAIITFEAHFDASAWCRVTADDGLPTTYIADTARVISTRPAYRPDQSRR